MASYTKGEEIEFLIEDGKGTRFGDDWPGRRCGAKAKSTGKPCRNPATSWSKRCRLHGGAKGSGILTPKGRAWQRLSVTKHGTYAGPGNPKWGPYAGRYWRGHAEGRKEGRRLTAKLKANYRTERAAERRAERKAIKQSVKGLFKRGDG